jgi:hypothetical protein
VRRYLLLVASLLLSFQAGVLAISPFVDCCTTAASQASQDEDECCQGMAPGQMCPLHKHRQPPKQTHHDDGRSGPALRCGCGTGEPALASLMFGLGIIPAPAASAVVLISAPAPFTVTYPIDHPRSLEPPPPR